VEKESLIRVSLADFEGKPARIEVKNLAEPEDWISRAALQRWEERSREQPEQYRFRTVLKHNSRGSVSEAAIKRLRTIIDTLPTLRSVFEEVLDGGIRVRLKSMTSRPSRKGSSNRKCMADTARNVVPPVISR